MDYRRWKQWKVLTRMIMSGCCAGAILAIFASGAAAAPVYTVQDLGALALPDRPANDGTIHAMDLNDSGQVVGQVGNWPLSRGAFLWDSDSGMTDLGYLHGSDVSMAYGINKSGQVVGESGSSAFLWEAGSGMTDLGDLLDDSGFSVAYDINDSGQVVGQSYNRSTKQRRAFLLDADGRMTDLGDLPGSQADYSIARAINNSGQVVGEIGEFDKVAVLWDTDGSVTELGDLPGRRDFSVARGINDRGQVVGVSDATTGTRAFLWETGGGMTDLGLPPGGFFSFAADINNSGQVVGWSQQTGELRAFLWDADFGMLQLDTLIDPLDPFFGIQLAQAMGINSSGQIAVRNGLRSFLLTPQLTPKPRAFLHCSRDLSADGSVAVAVVTHEQVTVRALDGTLINQFALNGLDDLTDTELMADTNGNGAPELVALDRASARAVVRDLLSGADLGTIESSADLAPIGLELAGDRTGNGIPDLAFLGHDPVRVQIRDGLTSGLVGDVEFSRYVTARDLTIYPDLDGSGALALAVLAENRRPEHADKIEIRNASNGETIRQIWLGKDWRVLRQERIGDLNGNGSEEVAVLQRNPQQGNVRVQIRDIETSAWVNFVGFANKYPPQTLVTIPDINGNGADELAVFGRHVTGTNQKAVIKDAQTGDKLNQLWFDRDFPGQDFVSCGDINGNGAADLALLGHRPEDGQLQVTVKDAGTGERLGLVWF